MTIDVGDSAFCSTESWYAMCQAGLLLERLGYQVVEFYLDDVYCLYARKSQDGVAVEPKDEMGYTSENRPDWAR